MIAWLSRNWGLKLISLILAMGLWYYAVGEEAIEIKRSIPLEIVIENENISRLKTSATNIEITLSVPRGMLSTIASEAIVARHVIGQDVHTAGEYSFRLQVSEIEVSAPYVRVMKIEPDVITVTLDELITKKVEVAAAFSGEPAFGYKVVQEEVQLNPNALLIQGPKAQLDLLDSINTKPIDLVGRIRSFRRNVELDFPANVKVMTEELIDVLIPIREELGEEKFEQVQVRMLKSAHENRKMTVAPEFLSFSVKGPRAKLDELKKKEILAYLDVSKIENGVHELPVQLVMPTELTLKEGAEIIVQVEVSNPA